MTKKIVLGVVRNMTSFLASPPPISFAGLRCHFPATQQRLLPMHGSDVHAEASTCSGGRVVVPTEES